MEMDRFFDVQADTQYDHGFSIGVTPIWVHRHMEGLPRHFHFLINIGFWFIEFQIGRDV